MKKLILVLIPLFMLACQDKQALTELESLKTQQALEEQNKSIIKHYWDGKWNERHPEILDELLTKDVINHGGTDEINGIEEYKMSYTTYLSAMDNTRFEIEEMIAEGNLVMSRGTYYATYNGKLGDIYPVGEELNIKFFTVFGLIDGKIAEEWELYQ